MGTRSTAIGRGLAPVQAGYGTLISYSTQPGNVALDGMGRNSPFTGALVRHLSSSNEEIMGLLRDVRNEVMQQTQRKQVPWEHTALTARFYFNMPDSAPLAPTAPYGEASRRAEEAYKQGEAALNRNDFGRAIADFNEAIRLDPKHAGAFTLRGYAYAFGSKKDFDRAIADYDEAIRLNPRSSRALAGRGFAYYKKNDFDRAIADYDEALRLNPKATSTFSARGNAYASKNDFDRAIADYDQAITLNPKDAGSLYNRGQARLRKGDTERGNADIAAAKRLDPDVR
jgi:tetratricopeptide (TPR) repeat protein